MSIGTLKPYGILALRETWVVAEATRKSMRGNSSCDTGPEVRLRQALWSRGFRGYRKNVKKLPGRPDVVFGRAKLAVFVHGCFWHGCPRCTRNRTPKTNAAYWRVKLEQNHARDQRNAAALEAMGYGVLVIWECEIVREGVHDAVARVEAALNPASGAPRPGSAS